MALSVAKVKVTQDETLQPGRKGRDTSRDEFQVEMDKEVGQLAATWRDMAEDPATVPQDERPRARFAVAPEDKAEFKDVLRRAGRLHKVEPAFYADATDAKGRAVVTFTLRPPSPKTH